MDPTQSTSTLGTWGDFLAGISGDVAGVYSTVNAPGSTGVYPYTPAPLPAVGAAPMAGGFGSLLPLLVIGVIIYLVVNH